MIKGTLRLDDNKNEETTNTQAYQNQFTQIVEHKLGITIHHKIKDVNSIIKDVCKKFNYTNNELLQALSATTASSPLLEYIVSEVTIGETYFFRDKNQMRLISEVLLPEIIKRKRTENDMSLRIWSAGCSSGEEIYTIGIMLKNALPDIHNWKLHLLGTDINTNVIRKAISGRYSEWSMRSISDIDKQDNFTRNDNEYIISDSIRNLAEFTYLNLNEDTYPSIFNNTNSQDLILCRNVLIYFDIDNTKKVMQKLSASLAINGYLILGASDPVNIENTDLVFHHEKGLLFSHKSSLAPVPKIIPSRPPTLKLPIQKPVALTKPIAINPLTIPTEDKIISLLNEAKWDEVLKIIDQQNTTDKTPAFIYNSKATALANLGNLSQAIKCCEEGIKIYPTNHYIYFTYALTLAETGRLEEAEINFKKTLFLDYQFVPGHFQLGLLQLRKNQKNAGLKCLYNALAIASTKKSSDKIPYTSGLTYGSLADILTHEIEIYQTEERDGDAKIK